MKEILIRVTINEEGVNHTVKSRGFEDNTSRHLEIAATLDMLAKLELDKIGKTKQVVLQRGDDNGNKTFYKNMY